jgi:hypothetical protein
MPELEEEEEVGTLPSTHKKATIELFVEKMNDYYIIQSQRRYPVS